MSKFEEQYQFMLEQMTLEQLIRLQRVLTNVLESKSGVQ